MKHQQSPARWAIVAVLTLYLGLGLAYGLLVPAFEAPDEPAHWGYVHYLLARRDFPVQQPDPDASPTLEAHQPPLYYLLAAAITVWSDPSDWVFSPPNPCVQWSPDLPGQRYAYLHGDAERLPYRDGWLALHLARGLSTLLGGITVWAVYQLGRAIWPRRRWPAATAAAVVALNPQFLFIHSAVNNDNLATTLAALILLVAVRAALKPPDWRRAALLGLLLGLGALTKYSVLALTPVALVGALLPPLRERRWRQAVGHLTLLLLIPLLLAGGWYLRNLRLYNDPWAWQVALASHPHDVRSAPLAWADLRLFAARVFASFWGYFGWLTVRLPPAAYVALALATALGGVGLALPLIRPRRRASWPLALLWLAFASVAISLSRYILTYNHTAYQGRLLFPAAPAIGVLLTLGWQRLFTGQRPARLFGVVTAAGLALTAICLSAILRAYPRPAIYSTVSLADLPQPCVVLGERAQLLAYQVTPPNVTTGETLYLMLHWYGLNGTRPGDRLAVQVLGRSDNILAQATLVPRLQAGEMTTDEVTLTVGDAARPTKARLLLQLLDGDAQPYPVVTRNRHPLGQTFDLLPVKVVPAQPPRDVFQEPVTARLGEAVTLLGYDLAAGQVSPGETLHLTLYWRAEAALDDDYSVFVHLMDETGRPLAQADGPPDGGSYPTSWWAAGEQIRDERVMSVGEATLPGRYRLGVGFYHPVTGERLPAFDAAGNRLPGDTIILAEVSVSQP